MTSKSITVTLLALSIYSMAQAFENFSDKIFTRDNKVGTNNPLIDLPEILKTKHINNKFMIYRKNNSKDKGEISSTHGFSQKIEKTPETVTHAGAMDLKIKTSSHSYLKNNKAIVITNYEILASALMGPTI